MSSVAELFGNPVTPALAGWRGIVAQQRCPYINSRCYKVRKSAPDVSIGTCAVNYGRRDDLLVICPARASIISWCRYGTREPGIL